MQLLLSDCGFYCWCFNSWLLSVLKMVFWHVSLGEKFLTFLRILVPSSPCRWWHYYSSKCWELCTQQNIIATQMTWILSNTIFRTLNLTLLPVQFVVVSHPGEPLLYMPLIQFLLQKRSYIFFWSMWYHNAIYKCNWWTIRKYFPKIYFHNIVFLFF